MGSNLFIKSRGKKGSGGKRGAKIEWTEGSAKTVNIID